MNLKKCMSAAMACAIVATMSVGSFTAASPSYALITAYAESTSEGAFVSSAFDLTKATIYAYDDTKLEEEQDTFSMNGVTYYNGIVFSGYGTNTCEASLNVENVSKVTFNLGHVDGQNSCDGTLTIYRDDIAYQNISLTQMMATETI